MNSNVEVKLMESREPFNLSSFGRVKTHPVALEVKDRLRGRLLRHARSAELTQLGLKMACVPGQGLSDKVIAEGFYEKHFINMLSEMFRDNAAIFKTTHMLDIGANIGNHTCVLSRFFKHVISFEPNPSAFHILAANVHINHLNNVTPVNLGMGSEPGKLRFVEVQEDLGGSLFTNEIHDGVEKTLEIVAGDEYLGKHFPGITVGFVKADVEGLETEVFKGLEETLTRDGPVVMFENSRRDGSGIDLLRQYGYTKFFGFHESYFKFKNRQLQRFCKILHNSMTIVEVKDPSLYHDIIACV